MFRNMCAGLGARPKGAWALLLAMATLIPATYSNAASFPADGYGKRIQDLESEVRLLKGRVKALESRHTSLLPQRVVQSGNSRVKVTLYGQVSRAVRFGFSLTRVPRTTVTRLVPRTILLPDNIPATIFVPVTLVTNIGTSRNTTIHHLDNAGSSTRLGVLARGRLFPGLTITGQLEIEARENPRDFVGDNNDGLTGFRARIADLYVTHADFGSLHIGHGSMASDAANLFSLSGTSIVFGNSYGDEGLNYTIGSTGSLGVNMLIINELSNFTEIRENRILYRTPRIAGFEFRVAHGEGDIVDFGIRYLGNPFGQSVKILAAFGYQYRPGTGATIATNACPGPNRCTANVYGGSLSALHIPSGISLSGSWQHVVNRRSGFDNQSAWSVEIGWQGKIWEFGKSYISAHLNKVHHGGRLDTVGPPTAGTDAHGWAYGIAFTQKIDRAATDIFAGYRFHDGKIGGQGLNAIHVLIVGARIKF